MNVVSRVEIQAAERPDRVAIRDGDRELTFGETVDLAARIATFLRNSGVAPGDRVGIFLPNVLEYLPIVFGIWKAGGVVVPLNVVASRPSTQHTLADSGAVCVFTDEQGMPTITATASEQLAAHVVGLTALEGATASFEDILGLEPSPVTAPRLDGEDAFIMYTSGSTGKPKGVPQTHRNVAAAVEATIYAWSLTSADSGVVSTRLFHVGGMQLTSLPLLFAGCTATLMSAWNAQVWVQLVEQLRPTVTALVPTMMIDVANLLDGRKVDLSSSRVCAVGGSALPPGPIQRFEASTGIEIVNIYGQTEQCGLAITEIPGAVQRKGCLGRPLEQILRWKIVTPGESTGRPAAVGEIGELWVRGDAVTPGYWNLPEVNSERFTDGWFHTGDMMRSDADGYLWYVERFDDLIISGGENIYPQNIESRLASSPDIAEVAVIGTPHERWVQQVTAIVVPRREGVTVEDIVRFCEGEPELNGMQRPRRIELAAELPKMATGKIDRVCLKQLYTT